MATSHLSPFQFHISTMKFKSVLEGLYLNKTKDHLSRKRERKRVDLCVAYLLFVFSPCHIAIYSKVGLSVILSK